MSLTPHGGPTVSDDGWWWSVVVEGGGGCFPVRVWVEEEEIEFLGLKHIYIDLQNSLGRARLT